jgi:hypothetical protein
MANSATQISNFCMLLLLKHLQKRELRTWAAFLKTFLLKDIPTLWVCPCVSAEKLKTINQIKSSFFVAESNDVTAYVHYEKKVLMHAANDHSEQWENSEMRNTQNLKPWKQGQSGNPGGRPRTKPVTAELERMLEQEAPAANGRTWAAVIAEALLKKARKGDVRAIAELANRIEGKSRQTLDLELDVCTGLADRLAAARKRVAENMVANNTIREGEL